MNTATENVANTCRCCGGTFDHINEEAVEDRCPKCQSAYRIQAAARMHETGNFRDYRMENFLRSPGRVSTPAESFDWSKFP